MISNDVTKHFCYKKKYSRVYIKDMEIFIIVIFIKFYSIKTWSQNFNEKCFNSTQTRKILLMLDIFTLSLIINFFARWFKKTMQYKKPANWNFNKVI